MLVVCLTSRLRRCRCRAVHWQPYSSTSSSEQLNNNIYILERQRRQSGRAAPPVSCRAPARALWPVAPTLQHARGAQHERLRGHQICLTSHPEREVYVTKRVTALASLASALQPGLSGGGAGLREIRRAGVGRKQNPVERGPLPLQSRRGRRALCEAVGGTEGQNPQGLSLLEAAWRERGGISAGDI